MQLHSMTGFAKTEHCSELGTISIEIKSINHRYLDLHIRSPELFRCFESEMRHYINQQLSRGKVDIFINFIDAENYAQKFELNYPLLETLQENYQQLSKSFNLAPLNYFSLLQFPQVLISKKIDEEQLKNYFFSAFYQAIDILQTTRAQEGHKLQEFMISRINEIEALIKHYNYLMPQWLQAQQTRFEKKIADLKILIEPERIQQEITVWLQKTDVAEEIHRLESHLSMLHSILARGGKMGRELEFYIQELNREANTLGAKTTDPEASHLCIQMKVFIEQMREQVQNIE